MGELARSASGGRSTFLWEALTGAMGVMGEMLFCLPSLGNICSGLLDTNVASMRRMGKEDAGMTRWVGEGRTMLLRFP